ncbi:MAG: hypothetical protein AAGA77_01895 [Bacteroidota bacterium]
MKQKSQEKELTKALQVLLEYSKKNSSTQSKISSAPNKFLIQFELTSSNSLSRKQLMNIAAMASDVVM